MFHKYYCQQQIAKFLACLTLHKSYVVLSPDAASARVLHLDSETDWPHPHWTKGQKGQALEARIDGGWSEFARSSRQIRCAGSRFAPLDQGSAPLTDPIRFRSPSPKHNSGAGRLAALFPPANFPSTRSRHRICKPNPLAGMLHAGLRLPSTLTSS